MVLPKKSYRTSFRVRISQHFRILIKNPDISHSGKNPRGQTRNHKQETQLAKPVKQIENTKDKNDAKVI